MENTNFQIYELELYITEIMLEIGIPAHLRGYYYLREAILLSAQNMEYVCSATKMLYPMVAKQFQTTTQKVERSIRNAIEVSWLRGNPGTIKRLFGCSNPDIYKRPTNTEYVARIADKVRLDMKALSNQKEAI
ncbi:MAG: sporulation initiation factor Spo0A C-terminal domain-containing protein [Lachnospiraceae bacterium]|jgi:two-component system response regulator (stage 0 sporulation protein A)|nr:sporulation initiation factor Spo0A C-terminal domain-containing protein [Lachnospiraceae bacterium]